MYKIWNPENKELNKGFWPKVLYNFILTTKILAFSNK